MLYRIKNLKAKIFDVNKEVIDKCKDIHPNLLGRLTVRELYDESFYDNSLKTKFDSTILPLVARIRGYVKDECNSIIEEYLQMMCYISNDGSVGILLPCGTEIDSFNCGKITSDNYCHIAALHIDIESFIEKLVSSMRSKLINFTPFWENGPYTSRGTHESVRFDIDYNNNTPQGYIDYNKSKIKHGKFFFSENSIKLMKVVNHLQSVEDVHIPACEDLVIGSNVVGHLTNLSINHILLDAVLESGEGFGSYEVIINDDLSVKSTKKLSSWS